MLGSDLQEYVRTFPCLQRHTNVILDPQMFWLLFIGQTITSATFLMENNGCSKLSALWFPSHERALATTLYTSFGSQVSEISDLCVCVCASS